MKSKMKKISVLLTAFMVVSSLAACGSGDSSGDNGSGQASYSWKAANVLAADQPWDKGLHHFAELLAEKSNGQIELTIYSGGQLGSEKDTMEGLQMGTVDVVIGSSATLSNFTGSQEIWDLPYLFKTTEAARETLDSEVGQEVIDTLADVGIKGLCYWENGTYAIGSKVAVSGPADLKGKKVRAIESQLQADTYACFGATAVVIAWGDIYTSLQQGVCDAVSSTTIPNMQSANLHEVAPYIIKTNHAYSPAPLLMSQSLWDSLPEDIQSIVLEAAEEARDYQRGCVDEALEQCEEEMTQAGCTFTEIDADEWSKLVEPIYTKYVGVNGIDTALVERVQKKAEEFY